MIPSIGRRPCCARWSTPASSDARRGGASTTTRSPERRLRPGLASSAFEGVEPLDRDDRHAAIGGFEEPELLEPAQRLVDPLARQAGEQAQLGLRDPQARARRWVELRIEELGEAAGDPAFRAEQALVLDGRNEVAEPFIELHQQE